MPLPARPRCATCSPMAMNRPARRDVPPVSMASRTTRKPTSIAVAACARGVAVPGRGAWSRTIALMASAQPGCAGRRVARTRSPMALKPMSTAAAVARSAGMDSNVSVRRIARVAFAASPFAKCRHVPTECVMVRKPMSTAAEVVQRARLARGVRWLTTVSVACVLTGFVYRLEGSSRNRLFFFVAAAAWVDAQFDTSRSALGKCVSGC